MKNIDLKDKYDELYESNERVFLGIGKSNWTTVNAFNEALTIVKMTDWSDKKVFEIGCGEGMLAVMIAHAGAESVLGIDYSAQAIKKAVGKFNIPSVEFLAKDYKDIDQKFDVITMEGVLEHMDSPFEMLDHIFKNNLVDGGEVITSCPSFLNPRGYVWMTLVKLFDVPMSLTDLHFICPFDIKRYCEDRGYGLEYKSIYHDWGSGEKMISDFNKRLRNALSDVDMDNSKVDDLLIWLDKAKNYFKRDNDSGAVIVYKISR